MADMPPDPPNYTHPPERKPKNLIATVWAVVVVLGILVVLFRILLPAYLATQPAH